MSTYLIKKTHFHAESFARAPPKIGPIKDARTRQNDMSPLYVGSFVFGAISYMHNIASAYTPAPPMPCSALNIILYIRVRKAQNFKEYVISQLVGCFRTTTSYRECEQDNKSGYSGVFPPNDIAAFCPYCHRPYVYLCVRR
jgi:hypothetical protein